MTSSLAIPRKELRAAALSLSALILLTPAIGGAEIETRAPGGLSVTPQNQDLRTECWQEGKKVFEADGFTGVDLETLAAQKSLRLSKPGQQRNALIVVPLDHTVCFVESED